MPLRVSHSQRFLVTDDGEPFFYLSDTAWELLHRLNREDAAYYLEQRAAQGFNVIQAVILAEFGGLQTPNAYGDLPLNNQDPAHPNAAYFKHVDWIVERANAVGLFMGLLPTWADKVGGGIGEGPEVFTPENAEIYSEYLGSRYRDAQIIWILGGDRAANTPAVQAIWRAMAKGLEQGDGGQHLMTFHPPGGHASSEYFPHDDWLDFTQRQTGHVGLVLNYQSIAKDYAAEPIRPCMDGEPCYEDHPVMTPQWTPTDQWFGDHAVRRAAYWALLAGACGHTYGCHDVWQMWDRSREPINMARTPWQEALQLPGAEQMRYARALIKSRPFLTRIPDQSLLVSAPGDDPSHVQASRDEDGEYAFVYFPECVSATIDLQKLSGDLIVAHWYDPRQGTALRIGEFPKQGIREFRPPSDGPDWVLVLDDVAKGFPPPGAPYTQERDIFRNGMQ